MGGVTTFDICSFRCVTALALTTLQKAWVFATIMALGAFQASLNILIHYERSYNGFYAPYFHIQLLGCNTNITDKLKLNVFMHL
jgi:hypothetical protein